MAGGPHVAVLESEHCQGRISGTIGITHDAGWERGASHRLHRPRAPRRCRSPSVRERVRIAELRCSVIHGVPSEAEAEALTSLLARQSDAMRRAASTRRFLRERFAILAPRTRRIAAAVVPAGTATFPCRDGHEAAPREVLLAPSPEVTDAKSEPEEIGDEEMERAEEALRVVMFFGNVYEAQQVSPSSGNGCYSFSRSCVQVARGLEESAEKPAPSRILDWADECD